MDLSLCTKCSSPLTDIRRDDFAKIQPGRDVPSLVGYVASIGETRFSKHAIRSLIRGLYDDAVRAGHEKCLYRIAPNSAVLYAIREDHALTLNSALHLASTLGISLLDLLLGSWRETNRQLFVDEMATARPDPRYKRRPTPIDRARLLPGLSEALRRMEGKPEPSLRALSRELGVSVGALWYHFPTLTREVSNQFAQICVKHRDDIARKVREAVEEGLAWWCAEHGGPPSAKALLRKLYSESRLPKNMLREQIKYRLFGQPHLP